MPEKNTLLNEEPHLPRWAKGVVLALVVTAGVLKPNFPDGSHVEIACEVVIALGAAFGIVSSGWRR
jgi:hypothetical protein